MEDEALKVTLSDEDITKLATAINNSTITHKIIDDLVDIDMVNGYERGALIDSIKHGEYTLAESVALAVAFNEERLRSVEYIRARCEKYLDWNLITQEFFDLEVVEDYDEFKKFISEGYNEALNVCREKYGFNMVNIELNKILNR